MQIAKHRWLALALTAALALGLLAGCGGNNSNSSSSASSTDSSGSAKEAPSAASTLEVTPTGDGSTIEFWNFFTGPDGENMNNMVEGFNATNPAFQVNNVTMAGQDLYQKIPTVVNSGKGVPDLTIVDVSRVPMFVDQGLLDSMDAVTAAKPEIKKENYRDAVWETGNIGGVQYSIPLDMGVTGLLYNKDLVEKYAPNALNDNVVTIDEIMEIIPKASADGIITIPVSFFTYEMALSLAAQEGATIFADDGVTPTINSPELVKAYQTLRDIQQAGGGSADGDDNLQLFMNGLSIFCHTGVWDYNALSKAEGLNWGMTNTIAYSPDKVVNYANSNQFVMLKSAGRSADKVAVIADFLEYVRQNTLEWARSGQVPASRGADNEEEFKNMNSYFFVSSPDIEKTIVFRSYKFGGLADDAVWSTHLDAIWGTKTPQEVLGQAQQETLDKIGQQQ